MQLHKIISLSEENDGESIEISHIKKYKKSLITYFEHNYPGDPILVVTDVFNACCYGFIATTYSYDEVIDNYVEKNNPNASDEDKENFIEVIKFQSIYLKNL